MSNAFSPEVLKLVAQRSKTLAAHQFAQPNFEQVNEAIGVVYEEAGIHLAFADMGAILNLYPEARIELAMGGCGDTETRELILQAVAYFFVNVPWPSHGSNVNRDRFMAVLQEQARTMGYSA